jgi:hypothetical protein
MTVRGGWQLLSLAAIQKQMQNLRKRGVFRQLALNSRSISKLFPNIPKFHSLFQYFFGK